MTRKSRIAAAAAVLAAFAAAPAAQAQEGVAYRGTDPAPNTAVSKLPCSNERCALVDLDRNKSSIMHVSGKYVSPAVVVTEIKMSATGALMLVAVMPGKTADGKTVYKRMKTAQTSGATVTNGILTAKVRLPMMQSWLVGLELPKSWGGAFPYVWETGAKNWLGQYDAGSWGPNVGAWSEVGYRLQAQFKVERDNDADGWGDITQDAHPNDSSRH